MGLFWKKKIGKSGSKRVRKYISKEESIRKAVRKEVKQANKRFI